MDWLYNACVIVGIIALVLISAVIPWAVFTRYVLNSAASWPEPTAVLLTILLTFIGAAAGYRFNVHMNLAFFVKLLPEALQVVVNLIVQLLMGLVALFMTVWGFRLVEVTWHNTIPDFPAIVGRRDLPADSDRRRLPAPVHHRAPAVGTAARSHRAQCRTASRRLR